MSANRPTLHLASPVAAALPEERGPYPGRRQADEPVWRQRSDSGCRGSDNGEGVGPAAAGRFSSVTRAPWLVRLIARLRSWRLTPPDRRATARHAVPLRLGPPELRLPSPPTEAPVVPWYAIDASSSGGAAALGGYW